MSCHGVLDDEIPRKISMTATAAAKLSVLSTRGENVRASVLKPNDRIVCKTSVTRVTKSNIQLAVTLVTPQT